MVHRKAIASLISLYGAILSISIERVSYFFAGEWPDHYNALHFKIAYFICVGLVFTFSVSSTVLLKSTKRNLFDYLLMFINFCAILIVSLITLIRFSK